MSDQTATRSRMLPIIVGNMFEWFDFTIYGFFATTIAHQFFPPGDEQAALLAVTATFGAAIVIRLIGAVIFGLIGDRWGRKTSLMLSFALMALGTAMIGLAPTYASVGVFAAVILVVGRLLQGFSASGEAGSALTLLFETTPPKNRGVAMGWFNVGVYTAIVFGSLAGFAVNKLLSPADAQAWGWRLPFLFGLLIAPIGLYPVAWSLRDQRRRYHHALEAELLDLPVQSVAGRPGLVAERQPLVPGGQLAHQLRRRGWCVLNLSKKPHIATTPGIRNRHRIAQLRRIETHESFAIISPDSPSLREALPGPSG